MTREEMNGFIGTMVSKGYTIVADRHQIAEAINLEDRAVFSFDLDTPKRGWDDCFEGGKCKVEWMYEGRKYYVGSTLNYFGGSKAFSFSKDMAGISSDEYLDDWLDAVATQRAPVIGKGTGIAIFFHSRKAGARFLLKATCTSISNKTPSIKID